MGKAKIRVVLDTSVLISSLKSRNPERSPSWKILRALLQGKIENYVSKEIFGEMETKLLGIGAEVGRLPVAKLIRAIILKKSKFVRPRRKFSTDREFVGKLGDINDAKFFDVAYAKKVDYLITEDKKHILKLRDKNREFKFNSRSVRILTSREFVRELLR